MQELTAVLCTRPGELELVKRQRVPPGATDAVIRIRRIGLCGTDYHIFAGQHPFLAYPRVMGHELAAEIVTAPDGSGFAAGDAVIVNPYLTCGTCHACRNGKSNCCARIEVLGVHRDGGMIEELTLPVGNLIAASGLSLDACATVEFLAIGAHAVSRSRLGAGSRVLVVGAGPIGLGTSIFARLAGGIVSLMDRDAERLASARAIARPNTTIVANDQAPALIAEVTSGDGYDVVFDATGSRYSMEQAFAHVAHGGTYVLVSVVKDNITFSDSEFHKREMTLMGSRNALPADFAHVAAQLRSGLIDVERLITHRTTLADVITDLPNWAEHKTGLVKALVSLP